MLKIFESLTYEDVISDLNKEDYRPTNNELYNLFNIFNKRYFNGMLPKIELQNARLPKDRLGSFYFVAEIAHSRAGNFRAITEDELSSCCIVVNNTVAFTKKQICETFIHEMIHLWQYIEHPSSVFIDGGHENFFLDKASAISAASPFLITATCDQVFGDRLTNDIYSIITDNPVLCLLYRNGEKFGVASIPVAFINPISSIILSSGKYSNIEFYKPINQTLLKKIDSIFGTNKEKSITLALRCLHNPRSVQTRDFTCASWYDIERMFDFKKDTDFVVGFSRTGASYSKPLNESIIKKRLKESLDNDIDEVEDFVTQSNDSKLHIEDIIKNKDGSYSVVCVLV